MMRIAALYRYPVKGLSPERLASADLSPGSYFPGDRLYAVENGPSGFDPGEPRHQPKIKFLMLMRNESLARLRTRYDDATTTLVLDEDGTEPLRADLSTTAGRLAVEAFFRRTRPGDLRGPPKVIQAPAGFRFTDSRSGYVSILNLASVRALEDAIGAPVDPLRFRANIHVEGLDPWEELGLVGRILQAPSGLRLRVTKRIERCAATNVDPVRAERDMDVPRTILRTFGHTDCGIYAEIAHEGAVSEGQTLALD